MHILVYKLLSTTLHTPYLAEIWKILCLDPSLLCASFTAAVPSTIITKRCVLRSTLAKPRVQKVTSLSELLRNADEKLLSKMRSSNHSIHQLLPWLKHYLRNCAKPIVCLFSHNVITTYINSHLFCEICFWTLIEIFCFYTMFITFVRWRLSVGIKRFTYLLTYLLIYLFPVWP